MAFSLLIVVAAAVGLFSWDRWLRYDDAAEFQGSWQAHGTTGVVVIDGERINLTDDVAYSYRIDPMAKTVSFSFGSLEGQGRYRFSLDRSQLVITEGTGYSWLSTLVDDIGWMADRLTRFVQGQPQAEVLPGDGVTVLDRLSSAATAAQDDGALAQEGPAADASGTSDGAAADDAAGANGVAEADDASDANSADGADDASGADGGLAEGAAEAGGAGADDAQGALGAPSASDIPGASDETSDAAL